MKFRIQNCPYTRSETRRNSVWNRPLISDLAVATEMVEWDDDIDSNIWAEVSPMGAYVLDEEQNSIVAYGIPGLFSDDRIRGGVDSYMTDIFFCLVVENGHLLTKYFKGTISDRNIN